MTRAPFFKPKGSGFWNPGE